MKTIALFIAVLFSTLPSQASNPLVVDQTVKIKFYAPGIRDLHLWVAQEAMKAELRKYDCLEANLETTELEKFKSSLFGKDKPGTVLVRLQTKCFAKGIKAVTFGLTSTGYDEDYTQFALNIQTSNGLKKYSACAYAVFEQVYKCPDGMNYKELVMSTPTQN